ncbi:MULTISPECIES: retron Ec78 anti-phage system effector HNH endonuclease PtuB [unclassified Marinobacter]|uniref:retron Ec78 anti-phage system effector HNH endonuclease PtuB n=1 Tax=unclassified Marinobacter TaxID=83889 RepID=UPI000BF72CE3|nr:MULTISPECIES: retron Ec78 anti-phage system effector HNH endonuclease PtuB [unclassified Marinobacter]PFG08822.1 uncharacterized protein (TIGR02646 family) [Marinobacter sp. LV10MA510-1]PFG54688.1 uncharacterized protein (TIGR02646 family) [Marinobacter sp. LV10R520-4]
MHQLNRPPAPLFLNRYRHGRNNWAEVTKVEKAEIWAGLNMMQSNRCAYCEYEIRTEPDSHHAHIEHFRQRNCHPQGTFDWNNLFGSCNRGDSCGKYKDKQTYEHHDLIKADQENPDRYLRFLPDGQVVPAENLAPDEIQRAEETIRVFNLNGSLRKIRETYVKGYLQTAETLLGLSEMFEEEEWRPCLEQELKDIAGQPFETAIRHVLQIA